MNRVKSLVNRAKATLSIVNCPLSIKKAKASLSTVNCPLSIKKAKATLSTVNCPLSIKKAKATLSIVNCQLSIKKAKAPLSIVNCQLSIILAALMIFGGCKKDKDKDKDKDTIAVMSVSVSPATLSLTEGGFQKLSATVLPAEATDNAVTWSSSATGVATVANDGTVIAVKAGVATIIATAGEKTGECLVEVTAASVAVTSITLSKTELELAEGADATLTATVTPDDATDKMVTWTSSNRSIATVTDGKVTAVKAGVAIITVTVANGSKMATCEVRVFDPSTIDPGVMINGVRWATRNLDAPGHFAATPEDYGKFYQWHRATAWDATGAITGWENTPPVIDSWTADITPAGWRLPTLAHLQTLLDNTNVTTELRVQGGITGRVFIDKTTNATLFLPAAGYRAYSGGTLTSGGGFYWSSTANGNTRAYYLNFGGINAGLSSETGAFGFPIRCVAE
jgi:uncharacterized protein (TIGR02145 family)